MVCVFFFQAASFQKFFHFSPGFGAAYPHISQAFSDSVPERTARIKGFHWHLKYHLNIAAERFTLGAIEFRQRFAAPANIPL